MSAKIYHDARKIIRYSGSKNWEKVRDKKELKEVIDNLIEKHVDSEYFDCSSDTDEPEEGEVTASTIAKEIEEAVIKAEKERYETMIYLRNLKYKNKLKGVPCKKRKCEETRPDALKLKIPSFNLGNVDKHLKPNLKSLLKETIVEVEESKFPLFNGRSRFCYNDNCNSQPCQSKKPHAICRGCDTQGFTKPVPHAGNSCRTQCAECGSRFFYCF